MIEIIRIYISKFSKLIHRIFIKKSKFSSQTSPVSRIFGLDRGTAIDRYYINKYLASHHSLITGNVLEIGDDRYTMKYGSNISKSIVLAGAGINSQNMDGDLTKWDTLSGLGQFDCVIATQTLNFIYDFNSAIENLSKLTKDGGVCLITVASLTQISQYDAERWGDYWRFTPMSSLKMFKPYFKNVAITSFGNVYSVSSFLYGFSKEELSEDNLDIPDKDYPMVVGILASK